MTACGILDVVFGKVISYFEHTELLKSLNAFRILENSVWFDMVGRNVLYGVEIQNSSNHEKKFNNFDNLIKEIRHSSDGEIYVAFVSRELNKTVYVFAYSQDNLSSLSSYYNTPLMSGGEIVNAIFNIYHASSSTITEDNRIVDSEEEIQSFVPRSTELINNKFKAIIQASTSKNLIDGKMYQGKSFAGKEQLSIVQLFNMNWNGTFMVRFDFRASSTTFLLKKYQTIAKYGDKDFAEICDGILNGKDKELGDEITQNVCISNAILYLNNDSLEKLASISNSLGISFIENNLTGSSIMAHSLFMERDYDFDSLISLDVAKKFFITAKKKRVSNKAFSYFWGEDICGDFISYNFKEASSSPHTIMIGRNGSGKSRQVIRMVEQMIGLNKERTHASRLGKIKIRYGDVGYTSGRLLETLAKHHPEQVSITSADINDLRFSLFDIEVKNGKVSIEEMDYMINIMNFALQTKDEDILSGTEEDFLRTVTTRLLLSNSFVNYPISILLEKDGYSELYAEILKDGYNPDTAQFSSLSDKYSHLKKPILSDIITALETEKNKMEYNAIDKDILERLSVKIRALKSYYFLDFHSNKINENDVDFAHIDFDSLKDTPSSFTVIYWMLMKRWIKMLKESAKKQLRDMKEPIDTFFIVEEAHNFFDYPVFAKMLKTASKELRKYGGKLIFISQQLSDIPEPIAKEMGTKIFVTDPSEKAALKEDISKIFKAISQEDSTVLDAISDYMMFIMYDGGSIGCKFIYEGDVEWQYKPYSLSF